MKHRVTAFLTFAYVSVFSPLALSQSAPQAIQTATQPALQLANQVSRDEIIVIGERTGPRLWRIENPASQNDQEKSELFVLMGVRFIPEDMDWNADQVAHVLDDSIELLLSPDAELSGGNRARILGTYLRTMIFSRDRIVMKKGVTLDDKVGVDLAKQFDLARLEVELRKENFEKHQKQNKTNKAQDNQDEETDVPRSQTEEKIEKQLASLKPERFHPYIQSQQLISDGIKSEGLRYFTVIEKRVRKMAKKAKVKSRPISKTDIAFSDVKLVMKSMKKFLRETNTACIKEAVRYIDEELDNNLDRANAWAQGDVAYLQATARKAPLSTCGQAVSNEIGGLKTLDGGSIADIDMVPDWMNAINESMQKPGTRLAIISDDVWLRKEGVLQKLGEKGYRIYGPTQDKPTEDKPAEEKDEEKF